MVNKSREKTKGMEKDKEEKIEELEKRIEELEKKEEEEPGIVGDVVSQFIPGLGGIVKTLEKTSPEFRRRIAQTNAEIKHRLETGWTEKPEIDYGVSIKPLMPEKEERVQKEEDAPEKEPIMDIFEENDYITVIAEIPGAREKDIRTELKDNILEISAGGFTKSITLPEGSRSITAKSFKNGILQLKIDREIC
ncbi:MAG: Hsp20/alpha crystallin family protein, partial [Candidatus Methanoperedens sp.]|nr:Hsp20/alpha crystallin family protein [Candidatus Methanoperedens sp.]